MIIGILSKSTTQPFEMMQTYERAKCNREESEISFGFGTLSVK